MEDRMSLSEKDLDRISGGVLYFQGHELDPSKTIDELSAELCTASALIPKEFYSMKLSDVIGLCGGEEWVQSWIDANFPTDPLPDIGSL